MHEGQRSHRKNGQNFNGKINIQNHVLLQEFSLTQGLNPGLLPWKVGSLPLSHLGSPPGRQVLIIHILQKRKMRQRE